MVFDKVTVAAEKTLWRSLPALLAGTAVRRPNDLAKGNYCGARTPEDGRIDWQWPASQVYDLVRAVAPPYPGAFTELDGKRLVVAAARLRRLGDARATARGRPGLHVVEEAIVGLCGDGRSIDISELRCEGVAIDAAALHALLATNASSTSS